MEEAWDRGGELTRELEDLDPQSIETDGKWLEDLEVDKTEILGEVSDYLSANKPESGAINSVSPPAQSGERLKVVSRVSRYLLLTGVETNGHISGVFLARSCTITRI